MREFDNGPSHDDWVKKIPVKVILDPLIGLKGALAAASNEDHLAAIHARYAQKTPQQYSA
jgi:hypothetical protein